MPIYTAHYYKIPPMIYAIRRNNETLQWSKLSRPGIAPFYYQAVTYSMHKIIHDKYKFMYRHITIALYIWLKSLMSH